MAAISHPEDKKRRGILSLFSRRAKSSTGESSLSSGSAGERSVSPDRSDDSADGRPTPRPLSPASSSATLTNNSHSQGPPPLSRPPSTLNLAKSRKRQAPAPPPPVPPGVSTSAQSVKAHIQHQEHTNGKSAESSEAREDVRASDPPGLGQYEEQSPYVSPAGSEVSSFEVTRQSSHPTNLTSVTSTSNLSLASRGKRRAPPPPKPPPTRHDDLPSAIPEESESPAPVDSAEEDERSRRRSVRSPSPASSQVSSVSSLSSVEHQGASTPHVLPPPPPPEEEEEEEEDSPPTPPPPSDPSNPDAALFLRHPLSLDQTEPSFTITYTPTSKYSLANARATAAAATPVPAVHPAVPAAPAASQGPLRMSHEAAETAGRIHNARNVQEYDRASGLISPDRVAEEIPRPLRQHHRTSSPGSPPAVSQDGRKRPKVAAGDVGEATPIGNTVGNQFKTRQIKTQSSDGESAKQDVDLSDAIIPHQSNMGNIPDIPMFRIVTKSQTAVKNEEDSTRKFVADGKTQKVTEEDKFGTKGKSSTNPLRRGRLARQGDVDSDDDLDINEDMFEPRSLFGTSVVSVNLSGNGSRNEADSPSFSPHPKSSTPVSGHVPQVTPRRVALDSQQLEFKQSEIPPLPRSNIVPPVPVPRSHPNKKMAPAPPPKAAGDQAASKNVDVAVTVKSKPVGIVLSVSTSEEPHSLEADQFERAMHEPLDPEFKVHVSGVSNVDVDMLSLLSEEGVDSHSDGFRSASRTSSESSESSDNTSHGIDEVSKKAEVKEIDNIEAAKSSPLPPSPVQPPVSAIPAQTTASSYRAGYLAMIAQLHDLDSTQSLDKDSADSSSSSSDSNDESRRGSVDRAAESRDSRRQNSEVANLPPPVIGSSSLHRGHDFNSSLCSDTDHEVQTRTASFSSETSEENSGRSEREAGHPSKDRLDDANVVGATRPEDLITQSLVGVREAVIERPKVKSNAKIESTAPSARSRTDSTSSESSWDSDNISEPQEKKASDGDDRAIDRQSVPSTSGSSSSDEEEEDDRFKSRDAPEERRPKPKEVSNKEATKKVLEDTKKEQGNGTIRPSSDLDLTQNTKEGSEKISRKDSTSSQSSVDSEGSVEPQASVATARDHRMTANPPLSSVRFPGANEISNKGRDSRLINLNNDRSIPAVASRRRSPASSVSSVTSNDSSVKEEDLQLAAHLSQEISKKSIENHLEAAFAEVRKADDPSVRVDLDLSPSRVETGDWEYKIPDPPTPFKDAPPSSSSSETVPEVLSDVPSGFKDSPNSSIAEAKNTDIIEKVESDIEIAMGGETGDSTSLVSSRKSSASGYSSASHSSDGKAKQTVIVELKTVVKETNNNEPRIVELKPKTRSSERVVTVPEAKVGSVATFTLKSSAKQVEVKAETLPVRVKYPVEHSFVPRVSANRRVDQEELRSKRNPNLTGKTTKDSTSSYESCSDTHDGTGDSSARSRSSSNTSYESAAPPIPEVPPPPSDYDTDTRRMRSSSSLSECSSTSTDGHQTTDTYTDSSLNRARVMNFSISTYRSRAEETSYDKRISKSESFSHQSRPKMGHLSKTDSFSSSHDQPEPPSFVDELMEEKERPPPIPEKSSFSSNASVISKIINFRDKPRTQQHVRVPEKPSLLSGKPAVPPKKLSIQTFGREGLSAGGQSVLRMNSMSNKHTTVGAEGRFAFPEPARPPRRLQHADSQERLGRTTSLSNLATPNFELRKAQSSSELSYGSGGTNPNTGGSEMPGLPGMMGMPGMPMMPGAMAGGMMPNDSGLAEEFVKLQQDFFKWQQQLLQNQHVLHNRVAPLASNPPQLQSVSVMRDIMSRSPVQDGPMEARNPAFEVSAPLMPSGPIERIIPIKMEITTTTTTYGGNELLPGAVPSSRLSQSMQDITADMGQLPANNAPFNRPNTMQQQPARRWGEEPNVSVGAWNERPSQPVGVYHDQDYVTSAPRSQSTQDLSSAPLSVQQRPGPFQTLPNNAQTQPQFMQQQTQPPFVQPQSQFAQPQQHFVPSQPQQQFVPSQQPQSQAQQFQSLPPQQQRQFAQFLQQQQQPQPPQPQEPNRATFWRDFDTKRQNPSEAEPMRPPRRNSRQDSPPQDITKPLTYFGQDIVVQEPPQTYYYNGDGPSALSKASENEPTGPRYTSVVTLSSDKDGQAVGEAPPKDKVRSVVQLNSEQPRNVPRTAVAPVVRGFRQPGEEKPGAGNFQSKIISSANKNQQPSPPPQQPIGPPSSSSYVSPTAPSPPRSVPVPEGTTAARLVAALSQPASKAPSPATAAPPARVSPPKTVQQRVSPARTSPARTSPSRVSPSSGPAFAGVQLRPVPAGLRASPPSDAPQQQPPVAPVAPHPAPAPPAPPPVSQMGAVPPPPPPAPPMAPPPPPANGERRTASGKRIVSAKTGPELDAREELMMAIRQAAGGNGLRKTGNFAFSESS